MKSFSPALKASYASGTTTFATCWKATLTNGTVATATSLDRDIIIGGVTYQSAQSYMPSNIDSSAELNPDNLEIEGFLASPAITDDDIHSGAWDYAAIEIFEVNYADLTQGKNVLRVGTLGEVRGGRSKFTAELRGLMQAYTRTIVRLVTQECTADLGDSRCKVDLAAITVTGSVASAAANIIIVDPARTEADDWFTGGKLTWTSGANSGRSMEVKRSQYAQLELTHAMYEPIMPGDTYTVYKGCMKRFEEDCIGRHSNGINFRGFPDLPGSKIYRQGGVHYDDGSTTGGSSGSGGGTGGGTGGSTSSTLSGFAMPNGVETGVVANIVGSMFTASGSASKYVAMDLASPAGAKFLGFASQTAPGVGIAKGMVVGGSISSQSALSGTVRDITAGEIATYLNSITDIRYDKATTITPPITTGTTAHYTTTKNGINFNYDFRVDEGYLSTTGRKEVWHPVTPPQSQWGGLAWSPELAILVCMADFGGGVGGDFMTTTDGINWTSRTNNDNRWKTKFFWSEQAQKFIYYTMPTLTGGSVFQGVYVPYNTMYSTDGINWHEQIGAPDVDWSGIVPVPGKGITVGIGRLNGSVSGISLDGGLTWSFTPLPQLGAQTTNIGMAYSPDLDKFVAVFDNVDGQGALTSTDGISWTKHSTPIGKWHSVSWISQLGLFIACGESLALNDTASYLPVGYSMMTSPDGVTWTPVTNIFFPVWLGSAHWSPELNAVVVDGAMLSNRRATQDVLLSITSTDGVNWATMQPLDGKGIWIPELGKYVGYNGWSDGTYGSSTTFYWPYDHWIYNYTPA